MHNASLREMRNKMKIRIFILAALAFTFGQMACATNTAEAQARSDKYVIVIHGGAGTISESMPDSIKQEYYASLKKALGIGKEILATVCNRYKGLTTEGGINTSAFIVGPGVRGGRIVRSFTHVMDITPTLLQLAGVAHADTYQGHPVAPIEGHSWANMLAGQGDAVWPAEEPVGWELFFRRAVRVGEWKAVYESKDATLAASSEPSRWWLYDVGRDPGETVDLSAAEPVRLAQLTRAWDAYAERVGVVLPLPEPPRAGVAPPARRGCGAGDDPVAIPGGDVLLGEDGPDRAGARTSRPFASIATR